MPLSNETKKKILDMIQQEMAEEIEQRKSAAEAARGATPQGFYLKAPYIKNPYIKIPYVKNPYIKI